MTHDVTVPFCMQELSISKTIEQLFHVDNDKGKLGICYDVISGCNLMVKLGLMDDFESQVLQWDGITVPIK